MIKEDTIAAIATAPGEGGIGIVRISGELSETILRSIFVPVSEHKDIENRKMTYGHIINNDTGEIVDEVLSVFMKAPHTYTTEDVAEINCHGSMVSLEKTLRLVLDNGARLAEPGEFTKRAFLNGRIDLTQAESVIDLIRAKTDLGYKAALGQLSGKLSEEMNRIRGKLVDVLVNIAVNIDYPDEDIEVLTYEKIESALNDIKQDMEYLEKSSYRGRIIREGLNTVIAGKPNVGKSSLMNRLLREKRSIVTEIPGTTRDTIEEQLNLGGVMLKLTDTAGIRSTDDIVEKIGVEKSIESLERADLILLLLDYSGTLDAEDIDIINKVQGREEVIVLLNKSDKKKTLDKAEIKKYFNEDKIIETSMLEDESIDVLERKIENLVFRGKVKAAENVIITNVRHQKLINEALKSVQEALLLVENKQPLEIIEIDVNAAWSTLGEVTGDTVREDIINEVFSRFCLGK